VSAAVGDRFVQDIAPACRDAVRMSDLTTIPNVGPAVARRLERLGITAPEQLRGADPDALYERLCLLDGRREDVCVLDTFRAAVSFANGGPARPWWEFSRERLAAERAAP
jgi:Pathogenicity locus